MAPIRKVSALESLSAKPDATLYINDVTTTTTTTTSTTTTTTTNKNITTSNNNNNQEMLFNFDHQPTSN